MDDRWWIERGRVGCDEAVGDGKSERCLTLAELELDMCWDRHPCSSACTSIFTLVHMSTYALTCASPCTSTHAFTCMSIYTFVRASDYLTLVTSTCPPMMMPLPTPISMHHVPPPTSHAAMFYTHFLQLAYPSSFHSMRQLYTCKPHQNLIALELIQFEGVCCKVN